MAIEAQACGTPVIAAAVGPAGGCAGWQHRVLVHSHDPADYTRALGGFVENPALSARMGAAAASHARSFGWDTTAAATASGYAAAMQNGRPH